MPSDALKNFSDRLGQVQQLLDAHGALVRLKKAEGVMAGAPSGLSQIKAVVDALVSDPSPGRPPEVQAINSGAIALLSAHLQGFVTDLFEEAATVLLRTHVPDIAAVLNAAPVRGNPNEQNIRRLFSTIGFADVLQGVSWQKMANAALRRNLREFNELRNRIVHGRRQVVHKSQVERYMGLWSNFAKRLDSRVGKELASATGRPPW